MTIGLLLIGMIVLVFTGVPIAISLGIVAVVAMIVTKGLYTLPNMPLTMFSSTASFPLLAVPLFMLAGAIMNSSGISRRLINFASAIVGFIRGGLAMVTTVSSMFFAEMSGSAVADVAALGSILIPAMQQKGYPKNFAVAVQSSSATLAVIIPPSIPMVLIAVQANCSVVKLFLAGVIPGIIGGLLMMVVSYVFAVRYKYPVEEAFRLRRVWVTFKDAIWAFSLPVIILGGIFSGFVTATEAAGLAVVAAAFIGFVIYREIDWGHLRKAIIDGASTTGVVQLLLATSALAAGILTELQMPQSLAQFITSITTDRYMVLAILNVFFLILGCFLQSAAAIILVVPIVMPLVTAVGIDPVHFGIIVTLNLGIGQQTPPVASVLIASCAVGKADIWEVSKINVYYIASSFTVLMLSTYIDAVPLFLVRLFYG